MEDGALPVRVLVDDRVEYLGQVVVVRVADVRAQDAVPTLALESGPDVLVAEPVARSPLWLLTSPRTAIARLLRTGDSYRTRQIRVPAVGPRADANNLYLAGYT